MRRDFEKTLWTNETQIVPSSKIRASWYLPKIRSSPEIYLNLVEKELSKFVVSFLSISSFTKKEWTDMGYFAEDWSITIKKVDKGSCIVVWDRNDYIPEVGKY